MAKISQKDIVTIVKRGGVGVLATDTLYGIVGSALSKKAVARIYRIRKRNLKKPLIILIASMNDCAQFGVTIDRQTKKLLNAVWPGKVSVILTCPSKKFAYLHRGTQTLAFRVPASIRMRRLLQKTGPLVAPSANIEGMPPATTVSEAKMYFGKEVDFYSNAGKRTSAPSTLVAIEGGRIVIATTVSEAKMYFGKEVDFYSNAGKRTSAPSTLVAIEGGRVVIKRQGSAPLPTTQADK